MIADGGWAMEGMGVKGMAPSSSRMESSSIVTEHLKTNNGACDNMIGDKWQEDDVGVHYTPPPIPVGFWFVQPELLESLESGGLFFVCSFPYVTQFQLE